MVETQVSESRKYSQCTREKKAILNQEGSCWECPSYQAYVERRTGDEDQGRERRRSGDDGWGLPLSAKSANRQDKPTFAKFVLIS